MTGRKQWRCFFCDEVFTRREDAAKHFGVFDSCEADVPACKLTAHEGHLVNYIRKLEAELRERRDESDDIMKSIMTLEADHASALRQAEEKGYERGVADMRKQAAQFRALLTDPRYLQMKADYSRGHLSWANMIEERERGLDLEGQYAPA